MAKILGIHTPEDGRNLLLNPEFWLFQRTDPSTPTARTDTQYGPDRWKMLMENTGVNISRSTSAPANSRYALLLAKSTSTGRMGMVQILEASDSVALRNKMVSFKISVQSPSSNVASVRVALLSWSGTADTVTADPISAWASTPTYAANFTQVAATESVVSNAYRDVKVSAIVPGSCNNLIVFVWTPDQEASGDSLLMGGAVLSLGASPILFNRRQDEFELNMCQRYFEKSLGVDIAPLSSGDTTQGFEGFRQSEPGTAEGKATFKVKKRITPTIGLYNEGNANGPGNISQRGVSANIPSATADRHNTTGISRVSAAGISTGTAIVTFHYTAEAEL